MINSIENLMLLCPQCHKLIDDNPTAYARDRLEAAKRDHEERIARVTQFGPNRKTAVLVVQAPIGGHSVTIPGDHVFDAVLPRYPVSRAGTTLDLNALGGPRENPAFYDLAREQIDRTVDRLFANGGEALPCGHVSVLALAPIPLLIHLGSRLTNKVTTDFFQRHRDTEDWAWKTEGDPVQYAFSRRRQGAAEAPVVLLLELSGSIPDASLPAEFANATVYALTLEGAVAAPTILRRREDLENFRIAYQQVLALVGQERGPLAELNLIPAVPAPVAILCGRERLTKFHPALVVYDYDASKGGYSYSMKVN